MSASDLLVAMQVAGFIEADRRHMATDTLACLLDPGDGTPMVAGVLAKREAIALQADHWATIQFVRDWYEERQSLPEVRWRLKGMQVQPGEGKGTRKSLHRLFPYGYGPQLCKIAGMTMPRTVMFYV